jgi:DivIVA domain-containing protein
VTLIVFIIIGILVVFGAALAFSGRWRYATTGTDRPPAPHYPEAGEWSAEALQATKFRVGLRGYRMQDVDKVLAALAEQLAAPGQRPDTSMEVESTPIPQDGPQASGLVASPPHPSDEDAQKPFQAANSDLGSAGYRRGHKEPVGDEGSSSGGLSPHDKPEPPDEPPAR